MKACVNCKHHGLAYSIMSGGDYCRAPQAKRFSRIDGPCSPFITPKVLTDCDENGWFEQKQPHWLMRFLSGKL